MELNTFSFENYLPWAAATTPGEQAFVTGGRNFLWTSTGVRSAWSLLEMYVGFPCSKDKECAKLICVGGEVLSLQDGLLQRMDKTVLLRIPTLFPEEELECKYRWSETCVGTFRIYSHPCYPLVTYDPACGWGHYYDPSWNSPIYGVGEVDNRLLVLLRDTVAFSAIDKPAEFNYSRKTGAGFQSLNLAKFGKPLGIVTLRSRAFVFTSNGIMDVRPSDVIIYDAENRPTPSGIRLAWSCVSTERPPTNPCAFDAIDKDNVVWYSKNGGLLTLADTGISEVQKDLSNLISENCPAAGVCVDAIEARSSLLIRYADDKAFVLQTDLGRIGRIDHSYESILCCNEDLWMRRNNSVYKLDDKSVTPDALVVTSALRLPVINAFDRPTREFHADSLEVFNAHVDEIKTDQYPTPSYNVEYSPSCDGSFDRHCTLQPIKVTGVSSTYSVDLEDLYHRIRLEGRFHIAGYKVNGRIAGKAR